MMRIRKSVFLSLGIFHYWLDTEDGKRSLDASLRSLLEKFPDIAGIELGCSWDELSVLARYRCDGFPRLTEPFASLSPETIQQLAIDRPLRLHLPSLKTLPIGQASRIGSELQTLASTGVVAAVMHPDGASVGQWEALLPHIPPTMRLTVENMDCRKSSFRRLPELTDLLRRYPLLRATFDVCHWLELGRGMIDSELYLFASLNQDRIDTIHYSVPSSSANPYADYPDPYNFHYLVHGSSWGSLRPALHIFPRVSDVVIEGSVPRGGIALLEAELESLGVRSIDQQESPVLAA